MAVTELTKDNFESTIWGNDVVLVDFWAPWHPSSQSYAPIYEAASEKHADIVFAKVNTEVEQELAGYFQIRSIPTLMLFREGVILYSEAGSLPADSLHALIEQVMQLDMEDVRQGIAKREAQDQA